jgi:HPt (histidine-containing phosphotransfer) domain-containing protein
MNATFPVLDREAIENLRAINPDDGGEFLRELIDIFLADTPKHLADLEAAIAAGQSVDLTRAAHSIKGSSGNFGATGLANLARDMESLGKDSEFAAAGQALSGLRAEFLRLHPVLEQLKQAG